MQIFRMISELSTNGKNLVDFGIRALPVAHHANQFMPAAWNEMDDVLDINVGSGGWMGFRGFKFHISGICGQLQRGAPSTAYSDKYDVDELSCG